MPTLRQTTTEAKGIDKQGGSYLSCLRSSDTSRANPAPDATNGEARLAFAAEIHDIK